jgi:hypothetical protein
MKIMLLINQRISGLALASGLSFNREAHISVALMASSKVLICTPL